MPYFMYWMLQNIPEQNKTGGPILYVPASPSAISQRALPLFPGAPPRARGGPAAAPRRPRGRARPVRILNCGRARFAARFAF